MTDRLALAVRVRKARHDSTCTVCRSPITVGQHIAKLIKPTGWCHVACVPAVANALATMGAVTNQPKETP